MKKIILAAVALLPLSLMAQTPESSNWKVGGVAGLNLSQTSLTNWAAGGENNLAGNIYINMSANYKKGKWSWDNALATDYGQTYTQSNKWQTSVDKLNLTSKAGYAVAKNWNVSFLADFLTQFTPGYASATARNNNEAYISNFLAPGYLNLAAGMDYRPSENLSLFYSPVSGKATFVMDKSLYMIGAFGVKKGDKMFAELGTSLVANYKRNLTDNISMNTKLSLFTAYTHNFGNIDVLWDVMLAAKINDYLSATVTTNLIYDDDIKQLDAKGNVLHGAKVQFREILGIGLAYRF